MVLQGGIYESLSGHRSDGVVPFAVDFPRDVEIIDSRHSLPKSSIDFRNSAQGVPHQPLVVSGRLSDAPLRARGLSSSRSACSDQSTATEGDKTLFLGPSGNSVPGPSDGGVESQAKVSSVTAMFSPPEFVSANSDHSESTERREQSHEEQAKLQRSGGSGSESCSTSVISKDPATSGVSVSMPDEGIFHASRLPERTHAGDERTSNDEDDSNTGLDDDSSEDENFNSSVRVENFGRSQRAASMIDCPFPNIVFAPSLCYFE